MTDVTLGITLKADGSGLIGPVKLSGAEFEKLGKAGGQAGQQASKGMDLLGRSLGTVRNLLGALGLGLSINQFISWSRRIVESVGNIGDLAAQLRIGTDELQALNIAAEEASIGTGQVQAAIVRLNDSIGEAIGGNKEMRAAFGDLGVAFADATGRARDNTAVLADLARRYDEAGDKTRFFADLTNVMGREAGRLEPILRDLANGWGEFNEKQSEFGRIHAPQVIRDLDALGTTTQSWVRDLEYLGARALHGWQLIFGIGLSEETELAENIADLVRRRDELFDMIAGTAPGAVDIQGNELLPAMLEELNKVNDQLLELERKANELRGIGTLPGAGAGVGGAGASARAEEAKATSDMASALREYLDGLREEVELLGMSRAEREQEIAVRQGIALAVKEERLLTDQEKESIRELVREKQALVEVEKANAEAARDSAKASREATQLQGEAASFLTSQIGQLATTGAGAFTELATGAGKFGDVVDRLIAKVIDLAFELVVIQPLLSALGGGGFFGGGIFGALFHDGGVVGKTDVPRRLVPARAFADAPRMHDGGFIGPDEVPVIAKVGEIIGPPDVLQRQFGGGGGGGGGGRACQTVVNIIDNRKGGKIEHSEQQLEMSPGEIKRIVTVVINDTVDAGINSGRFDRAMGQSFGLRRTGFSR